MGCQRGPRRWRDSPARAAFQDFFLLLLVYDPQQKTLLADKGEIRVGNRYQADITEPAEKKVGGARRAPAPQRLSLDPPTLPGDVVSS